MGKSNQSAMGKRATELVRQHPKSQTRTLARKLHDEFKDVSTLEQCRSLIRYRRGNTGVKNRKLAKNQHGQTRKAGGKAGWVPSAPPSLAEEWTPSKLQGAKRVGVLSDTHIPYHSSKALETAVKTLKDRKIDTLVLNGDYGDWYSVSRWQKDPRKRNLKREIELQREGLAWLRKTFGKKTRIVFKNGNHEDRWEQYIWNHAADLCDLDEIQMDALLQFDKHGVEWVKDERPIMAGMLPLLHGHELGRCASGVNVARSAFMRAMQSVMVGHSHRTSGHCEPNMFKDEIFCWSIGCLCDLAPQYWRVNKWNHGFAAVEVGQGGSFQVTNYRISKRGEVRTS